MDWKRERERDGGGGGGGGRGFAGKCISYKTGRLAVLRCKLCETSEVGFDFVVVVDDDFFFFFFFSMFCPDMTDLRGPS